MARLQKRTQAAVTTGTSRNTRPSLRDGFNAYAALSSVLRAFWPPSPRGSSARLDLSVGRSGPHGFASASTSFVSHAETCVTPTRPSRPAANVRDDREAPLLSEAGRDGLCPRFGVSVNSLSENKKVDACEESVVTTSGSCTSSTGRILHIRRRQKHDARRGQLDAAGGDRLAVERRQTIVCTKG